MSTFEKAPPDEQAKAPDGSHKFQLELSITDTQIRNAEYAIGAVVTAATIGLIAAKTGKLALLQEALPEFESTVNGVRADCLRFAKVEPKMNYYQLKNGLQLTYSKNSKVAGETVDLISVAHPIEGEAHLLKDGSRMVYRSGISNFHDQAGKGIEVAFPSREIPTVRFPNDPTTTAISKKAFRTIENSFLTGSTKPIEKWSDLFDQVTKL